jgi:hypothetical protein
MIAAGKWFEHLLVAQPNMGWCINLIFCIKSSQAEILEKF